MICSIDRFSLFESPDFHDTLRLAAQSVRSGPAQILITFANLLKNVVSLIGFIGILVILSPFLAFVLLLTCLPQLFIQVKLGQQRFNLKRHSSPNERQLLYLSNILSNPSHIKEIFLFNLGDFFIGKFTKFACELNEAERKQQFHELRAHFLFAILSSIINSVALISAMVQAYLRQITLGDITLYITAFSNVHNSLSNLVTNSAILSENALFFSSYRKLLLLSSSQVKDSVKAVVPELGHGIHIERVSFRYSEEHDWVLSDFDLFIPKGKCVALVGVNGAGKSTLVKLLTRLYDPSNGQITWDGIDIRDYDSVSLRQKIGVIFQDFVRYEQTAYENIAVGNIQERDNINLIHKAAMVTGAHQFVINFKHSYDTLLSRWLADEGEGVELSGGQWQKIALSRMFMRDADFLILDEPTSSLDTASEYELYQNFSKLVKGKTSLLVSHRFSTVRMADFIAVLENGKIAEYGTHQQLMLNGNTYAKLYAMQVEQYFSPPIENSTQQCG
jgi:ATP-binding cassette subfamily B protein